MGHTIENVGVLSPEWFVIIRHRLLTLQWLFWIKCLLLNFGLKPIFQRKTLPLSFGSYPMPPLLNCSFMNDLKVAYTPVQYLFLFLRSILIFFNSGIFDISPHLVALRNWKFPLSGRAHVSETNFRVEVPLLAGFWILVHIDPSVEEVSCSCLRPGVPVSSGYSECLCGTIVTDQQGRRSASHEGSSAVDKACS